MGKSLVVLHHSATKDSGTVSWDAIERYHKEELGWRDIGYHYGVEKEENGNYVAVIGRDELSDAAAVKEGRINQKGIHVCIVGDFNEEAPDPAAIEVLVNRILLPVTRRNRILWDNIKGHNFFNAEKACPGTMFPLEEVRQTVKRRYRDRRV